MLERFILKKDIRITAPKATKGKKNERYQKEIKKQYCMHTNSG